MDAGSSAGSKSKERIKKDTNERLLRLFFC